MPTASFSQSLLLPSFGYMEAQAACESLNRKNPSWNTSVAFNGDCAFTTDFPVDAFEFKRVASAEIKSYFGGFAANLSAVAYGQGTDIFMLPGQEQTLGHEAWHVVQQGK